MGEERREERPRRSYGRRGAGGGSGGYSRGRGSFGRRGGGGGYGRGGGESYGRGGGRDFQRDRGPSPVEEGQEVDVKIESVGRRGDGIARVNNFVIFVPNTNEGEQVKVRITAVRNSFATGEVVGRSEGGEGSTEKASEESFGDDTDQDR
ncbi:MAG TPA: TRAM domain-containing protein [Candidatus Bathyarchaeia archaeon]|nr:TRAM domain-containing protein [Candidatus Bathyarchaeia archaeon]